MISMRGAFGFAFLVLMLGLIWGTTFFSSIFNGNSATRGAIVAAGPTATPTHLPTPVRKSTPTPRRAPRPKPVRHIHPARVAHPTPLPTVTPIPTPEATSTSMATATASPTASIQVRVAHAHSRSHRTVRRTRVVHRPTATPVPTVTPLPTPTRVAGTVTLVSYWVSSTAARRGTTIGVGYVINNQTGGVAHVMLGASLKSERVLGWLDSIADPAHDVIATVPPGVSTHIRYFTLPSTLRPGGYDVAWGLKDAATGQRDALVFVQAALRVS